MEKFRFKVNLGGMIEILSEHLYSSPDVYVRELLQNGVDAITAREKADSEFTANEHGKINIVVNEGKELHFFDNGVGLSKEEIHKFIAVIGQSSKKDLESGRIFSDYIGRFGIGLLSYFMVSDEIVLRTKSISEEQGYEWVGHADGTYTLSELDISSCGTEIYLKAKKGHEDYFTAEKVENLIMHYGMILPYPIYLDNGDSKKRINPVKMPWDTALTDKQQILMLGQILFGQEFMDCIVLHSEVGGVDGIAYILPNQVQASTKQQHLVYLKNMLLTENGQNILPNWAVFTKCIINARDLRPTASREDFYDDEVLESVREEIGEQIAGYIKELAKKDHAMYRKFLDVHGLVVKSMAIDDDELFELFIDDLDFYTTRSVMTGLDLKLSRETILYANMEEYKQFSQVFVAQGKLLVNAGYVYTKELLFKLNEFYGVEIAEVKMEEIDELLKDVSLETAEKAVDLLNAAENVMSSYNCGVEIKQFIPVNLPAFFYINSSAKLLNDIEDIQKNSSDLFADMLGGFVEEIKSEAEAMLYLNANNPIIKKMLEIEDDERLAKFIEIIYIQSLLIGGFSLRNNELSILNDRILYLMEQLLL